MAAGSLAKPGSEFGPCEEQCDHKDCAQTRAMAASRCRICDMQIGYGTYFYDESQEHGHNADTDLVHATCLEIEVNGLRTGRKSKTAADLKWEPEPAAPKTETLFDQAIGYKRATDAAERADLHLSAMISALIDSTESLDTAQAALDELQMRYDDHYNKIAFLALDARMFADDKTGTPRKANNADERTMAIKLKVRSNGTLRKLRREVKSARRRVSLLRGRIDNFRVIVAALGR